MNVLLVFYSLVKILLLVSVLSTNTHIIYIFSLEIPGFIHWIKAMVSHVVFSHCENITSVIFTVWKLQAIVTPRHVLYEVTKCAFDFCTPCTLLKIKYFGVAVLVHTMYTFLTPSGAYWCVYHGGRIADLEIWQIILSYYSWNNFHIQPLNILHVSLILW